MGRLSTYAKNQILKLRFQKHFKITQIVKTLSKEDKIKISRQSVSTFLKKYLETDSIHDKPRSGRKRKLTKEEIELIGELTRTNRDITARAIKEYLNLNVSTYTILRATKLFEWNKFNPNSNAAKKQAALERKQKAKGRKNDDGITDFENESDEEDDEMDEDEDDDESEDEKELVKINHLTVDSKIELDTSKNDIGNGFNDVNDDDDEEEDEIELPPCIQLISLNDQITKQESKSLNTHDSLTTTNSNGVILKKHQLNDELFNLNLLNDKEIIFIKNNACSPMSFATKILFKIYSLNELHGHNVSGKTFHRHILNKKPLEEKRLMYIRYLVEKHFKNEYDNDENKFDALWKSCCNAINKMIRRSELQHEAAAKNLNNLNNNTSQFNNNNNNYHFNESSSFNEDDAIIINDHTNHAENIELINQNNNSLLLSKNHEFNFNTLHQYTTNDHTYQIDSDIIEHKQIVKDDFNEHEDEIEMHRPSKFVIVAAVHQPSTNPQKKLIRISSAAMPVSSTITNTNASLPLSTPKIQIKSIKI